MRRGAENSHNYIKFNVSAATMRGLKSLWVQIVIADRYSDELIGGRKSTKIQYSILHVLCFMGSYAGFI